MNKKLAAALLPGDFVEVNLKRCVATKSPEDYMEWYLAKVTSKSESRTVGKVQIVDVHVALLGGREFTVPSTAVRKSKFGIPS